MVNCKIKKEPDYLGTEIKLHSVSDDSEIVKICLNKQKDDGEIIIWFTVHGVYDGKDFQLDLDVFDASDVVDFIKNSVSVLKEKL